MTGGHIIKRMKELMANLIGNLGQNIVIALLLVTTTVTTSTAIKKVENQPEKTEKTILNTVPQINSDNERKATNFKEVEIEVTPTKSSTPTPTKLAIPKAVMTAKPIVTTILTNNTNRCLVTLFGKQYDVTSLRGTHGGGDIFNCGADMSTIYQNKHGSGLSRVASYLYDPNNPNAVITGATNNKAEDDKREDQNREDDD